MSDTAPPGAQRCASVSELWTGAPLLDDNVYADLHARLHPVGKLFLTPTQRRQTALAIAQGDEAWASLLLGLYDTARGRQAGPGVLLERLRASHALAVRLATGMPGLAVADWPDALLAYRLDVGDPLAFADARVVAADYAKPAAPGSDAVALCLGLAMLDPGECLPETQAGGVRRALIERGREYLRADGPVVLDPLPPEDPDDWERNGIVRLDGDGALAPAQPRLAPSCVVLAAAGALSSKGGAQEAAALVKPIAGKALPLAQVPDGIAQWEKDILREFPHAGDAARALVAAQEGRRWLGGPPIILVGETGAGKTRLVRRACELVGLPMRRYAADAASDNSFAGTPRRWHSGGPSFPLAAIIATGTANPVIHVDEVEKAAGDRRTASGRFHDALVSLWEPESASRYQDTYVEAECDLSNVWYLCTANTLEGIPSFLLDRARVVQVPQPGPEHLAALAPQIARELLVRRGQDPRWGDLDGDEMAVLARHWRGGSLRSLTRAVEALLHARDAVGVRHAH